MREAVPAGLSSAEGLHGGAPLTVSPRGERVGLTPPVVPGAVAGRYGRRLEVHGASGALDLRFEFDESSGSWGYATFSADGDLVVAGTPFDLFAFERVVQIVRSPLPNRPDLDLQRWGELALTRYFDPSEELGLGTEWERTDKRLREADPDDLHRTTVQAGHDA